MDYKSLKFDKDTLFLVTGGAGFIGSNLCEAILDMGYKVRCLDDLSTGFISNVNLFSTHNNYEFIKGDIKDLNTCINACEGVDFVLHQAAWGSVPRSIKMPIEYEENNIKGTLNMMEAARQCSVKKFVFASSSSVYGDHTMLPKREGTEGKLLSPYALTKMTCEKYGEQYTRHYSLDTYALRYFNVYGKRQDPNGSYAALIPRFLSLLLSGKRPTINGDGTQSRDFTFVEDVIQANLLACLAPHEAAGQVYNVAFGGREVLNDIYCTMTEVLGVDIEPIYGPERVGDIKHSNADITKARKILKYDPQYSFEKGLSLAIKWYKENLNNDGGVKK